MKRTPLRTGNPGRPPSRYSERGINIRVRVSPMVYESILRLSRVAYQRVSPWVLDAINERIERDDHPGHMAPPYKGLK